MEADAGVRGAWQGMCGAVVGVVVAEAAVVVGGCCGYLAISVSCAQVSQEGPPITAFTPYERRVQAEGSGHNMESTLVSE